MMVANISKHLLCARNSWVYIFNPKAILLIVQGGNSMLIVQVGSLRLPELDHLPRSPGATEEFKRWAS